MATPKYTKKPEPTGEMKIFFETVLQVLAGTLTETAAAERLKISRVHFQNMMNRGLHGMIEGMTPKPPGRPPERTARESELERENARLRSANAKMEDHAAMLSRIFEVGSRVSQGKSPVPRVKKKGDANDPEEPDPATNELLRAVADMTATVAAFVLRVSPATVRRMRQRAERGEPQLVRNGRPPKPMPPRDVLDAMVTLIDATRGQTGIRALRQKFPEVSRRQTAYIKRVTVGTFQRRRREHIQRIDFSTPGVVRGFDAMFVKTTVGLRYLLVAVDAACNFRTTLELVETYDQDTVLRALERDFATHGAPLVLRLDRASCHRTEKIQAFCARLGVLMLHGPPHHPRYYGQLERGNRDHRGWLDLVGLLSEEEVRREIGEMRAALNDLVPRSKLAWSTATEAWDRRLQLGIDRVEFARDITARAAELRLEPAPKGATEDRPERLAIEEALTQRGFLSRRTEGWC